MRATVTGVGKARACLKSKAHVTLCQETRCDVVTPGGVDQPGRHSSCSVRTQRERGKNSKSAPAQSRAPGLGDGKVQRARDVKDGAQWKRSLNRHLARVWPWMARCVILISHSRCIVGRLLRYGKRSSAVTVDPWDHAKAVGCHQALPAALRSDSKTQRLKADTAQQKRAVAQQHLVLGKRGAEDESCHWARSDRRDARASPPFCIR